MSTAQGPEPHQMRISSSGAISAYVTFALSFLRDSEGIPLVLHTRPNPPNHTTASKPSAPASDAQKDATKPQTKPKGPLLQCTTTTPRLISVVELIKREYISELRKAVNRKGKGQEIRAKGIWQYTESGLHVPPSAASGLTVSDEAGTALARVLGGSTKPRMVHHPYLSITLSTKPLPTLEERGASCQYVLVKHKSRGRKKPGKNRAEENDEQPGDGRDGMDVDPSRRDKETEEIVGDEGRKRKSTGADRTPKKRRTGQVPAPVPL